MAGDYAKARRITVRVTDQMVDEMGPGEVAEKAFGLVLTLRALAEAGLGNDDDAIWYWQIALNLFPELGEQDFERFGAPGELLRAHPLPARSPAEEDDPDDRELCEPDCDERLIPPKVRKKPKPRYPLGARHFHEQGALVVAVVIGKDGSVSEPRILEPLPSPTMSFAVLEAVRQWEFEPARLDGKVVAAYYHLTTNFKLRH